MNKIKNNIKLYLAAAGVLFFLQAGLQAQPARLSPADRVIRTLVTPHFRIHYPEGKEDYAKRIARMAEYHHARMEPRYQSGVTYTHVVLVFDTDMVNAYATVYGRDQVVLFLNNPDYGPIGASGWTRFDLWAEQLFIHEYAHILSIRYIGSFWSHLIRLFAGLPPNYAAPQGMTEGVAVYEESLAGKGRNNDPITSMIFRAAVTEDRLPDQAEMMTGSHRWPYGTLYYIYGGAFNSYLADRNSDEQVLYYWKLSSAHAYLDSRLRYSGMKDYLRNYKEFISRLKNKAAEEIAASEKKGKETPFVRLTENGGYKAFLVPDASSEGLFFYGSDQRKRSGVYRISLPENPEEKSALHRVRRADGVRGITHSEAGLLVSEEIPVFSWAGIRYELTEIKRSWYGRRLFPEVSAVSPSADRTGQKLLYIERKDGKQRLILKNGNASSVIYEVPDWGLLQNAVLSSDGRFAAFTARKTARGEADLILCEPGSDKKEICRTALSAKNSDVFLHPSFSPDGTELYFTAELDGFFDIYSIETDSGELYRRTLTHTGLFYPVARKDGLYSVRYHAEGYDLVKFRYEDLLKEKAKLSPVPRYDSSDETGPKFTDQPDESYPRRYTDGEPFKEPYPREETWRDKNYPGIAGLQPFLLGLINAGNVPGSSVWSLGAAASDPVDRHFLMAAAGEGAGIPEVYAAYSYSRFAIGFQTDFYSNYRPGIRGPWCKYDPRSLIPALHYCESQPLYKEQSRAALTWFSQQKFFYFYSAAGYSHSLLRNIYMPGREGAVSRDMNLSGPWITIQAGDYALYPQSVSPEAGFAFTVSAEHYSRSGSWKSYDAPHKEHIEFGKASGGLALFLPSFFRNHVNYLSGGYTALYGPERSSAQLNLSQVMRGMNAELAPEGSMAAYFTYEYRFPVIWISRGVWPGFSELKIQQIGFSVFADTAQISQDFISTERSWHKSYGATLSGGFMFYHVAVPVQFSVSYIQGSRPFGERQIVLRATFGGANGIISADGIGTGNYRRRYPTIPAVTERAEAFRSRSVLF